MKLLGEGQVQSWETRLPEMRIADYDVVVVSNRESRNLASDMPCTDDSDSSHRFYLNDPSMLCRAVAICAAKRVCASANGPAPISGHLNFAVRNSFMLAPVITALHPPTGNSRKARSS